MTCVVLLGFFSVAHRIQRHQADCVSDDQFATKDLNSSQTDTQVGLRFDVEKIGGVLFSFFFKKNGEKGPCLNKSFRPIVFENLRDVGEGRGTGDGDGGLMDREEKKPFPATGTEAFFFPPFREPSSPRKRSELRISEAISSPQTRRKHFGAPC